MRNKELRDALMQTFAIQDYEARQILYVINQHVIDALPVNSTAEDIRRILKKLLAS